MPLIYLWDRQSTLQSIIVYMMVIIAEEMTDSQLEEVKVLASIYYLCWRNYISTAMNLSMGQTVYMMVIVAEEMTDSQIEEVKSVSFYILSMVEE